MGKCKECCRLGAVLNRRKNQDRYNQYDRDRNQDPARKELRKKVRDRHPERIAARNAVSNAIRLGKLIAQPCEVCGTEKAHGHHEDYSKPLEVIWLCHTHHMERHRKY